MKRKNRLSTLPAEAIGNIILLAFLVCSFALQMVCYVLCRLNIFYIPVSLDAEIVAMHVGLVVLLILGLIILCTKGKILQKPFLKYILLFLVFLWVCFDCSTVYFHTTLMLIVPLLIARCYNEARVTYFSIFLSAVLIIITPILAFAINGMDITFPLWEVYILGNKLGVDLPANLWNPSVFIHQILDISPYYQILLWVVLPRMIIGAGLIVIASAGNYANRKSYEQQIKQIRKLQDAMIDSMSEIIENRDISTGGHVRRTQDNVRILVENLKPEFDRPQKYWDDVIKSSAMHDLGKIAISDDILKKPGRLTTEEFEQIKIHPMKSKSIIVKILETENDAELKEIAYNIALYHHEKYDGSGYPEGISGEDIPLEARIMAIADVYDALVSERCYKKPFSFEEAYQIMKNSMGTHFDPNLWNAFEKSVPQLEDYYSKNRE